ncbi:MAG: hypothetical protein ACD_30C00047G0016 [uncultured bacterium]|uniref:UPF0235 protein US19_C0001G0053 n=4 Tax=Candidatus Daviesiibacteriota TaxID=1752718 RepID=A0A0G0FB15_9BACT|nr:MAG: hypothetical protein ACD_30C00047G0016 [uncultured bacterium]KKQ10715.1 MAG: hypothetical protein US19_C0001G0053 [Candidatus Daviesbacteria bacterium GW2011_GWB1_36_5]KKQ15827.1 MAG: hypothetical protein US28_C0009G0006 [Candidatus Daviesbacteria bacterium GW2011_GWA1_36_8]OGE16878.1 MAG: hypothetical protein A2858_03165 [Candidatus Daviesbacteria bacterium RIFCSPHIGHO2_01_FULL_36_37]OGE31234.1 MAG: hypothetical protein A3C99_01140 [Candidatus Daviesbacteria bacterium RIFCSPHIGHO2_02_F
MKISVSAKPKSKKEFIKKLKDFSYSVAVKEEAKEGRANEAVIKALSEYFNIPKSEIKIVTGLSFKQKIIELPLTEKEIKEIEDSKILQPRLIP